ncbi:MAG: hypothetical protein GOVbin212_21 [Prokaryotic dsDNA virus sp.]|nr:MAG: hypothetical protein GOVbin212_21 [Prokaryotic dsDNA virus sp.]|tara:strand:- start:11018 stop:11359 length:342 start_codon:yes stop_codon:yes gene_type:complete
MKFTGKVEKGNLKLHDIGSYRRFLNGIKGEVWIEVKEAPKMRSVEQNNYYRHIIRQIGNHLGYSEDEMHDVIKQKFAIESTKDLSRDDFSELLDRIIRFSATLGFVVQDPRRS